MNRQTALLDKLKLKVAVMVDEQTGKLKRNSSQTFLRSFAQAKNMISNQMIEGLAEK